MAHLPTSLNDLDQGPDPAVSTSAGRLRTMHEYARELRSLLPASVFQCEPVRLLWLPAHLTVIIGLGIFLVRTEAPWYVALLCGVVSGHSWGCLTFLAHEAMHHALVKPRILERVVGFVGFAPYCLSPTLWSAWHNQAHHGYTGNLFADPDLFGTLPIWEKSALVRWVERLGPGSGYKRSAAFLFVFFSLQSLFVLLLHSERKGFYCRISRRSVYLETAAIVLFWGGILWLTGPQTFLFLYVVPALTANGLLMSYIATNHYLNPLTSRNDPLANSLSVTAPRWIEWLHLQFGYHVEHHVFPTMSAKHAPEVRQALLRLYGARYLSMPHGRALQLLYARPKLHLETHTLIDPRSESTFLTLSAGDLGMRRLFPAKSP